jgi:hypothetical protein
MTKTAGLLLLNLSIIKKEKESIHEKIDKKKKSSEKKMTSMTNV